MSEEKNEMHSVRFKKDPEKKYIRRFRIYPTFAYRFLDKWLKSMSAKGWHVVHSGLLGFVFENGEPCEKEYFTYCPGLITQNEGFYCISLRHPCLERIYGVDKQNSKINANSNKLHEIVEIDTNRIDVHNNIGYKELVSDRNYLYKRYFIRNLCLIVPIVIVLAVIFSFRKDLFFR